MSRLDHPCRRRVCRRVRRLAALAAAATLLGACHWIRPGPTRALRPVAASAIMRVDACRTTCTDSVDLVATGVDGYLVVPWRDTTRLVLMPPSITNPSLVHLALLDWWWGTRANTARIARRVRALPTADSARLAHVAAVIVGHGHYDHLLDLPPLLRWMPRATVHGSATVAHLLAPVSAPRRIAAPGDTFPVGATVRLRTLAWAHAPNIGGFTFAPGQQRTPRTALPRTTWGWKLGEPLAWTIDVLDAQGAVAVRLFLHDAAAPREVILRAVEAIAQMPRARSTIAVLSAANYDQAAGYPEVLLATLTPHHVVFGHWEDFFRSPERSLRVVRGIRARDLIARVEPFVGQRWTALEPGATLRMRVGPN